MFSSSEKKIVNVDIKGNMKTALNHFLNLETVVRALIQSMQLFSVKIVYNHHSHTD